MTTARVAVDGVELWAAPVPLPTPIFTPAGTFDTYHHLVVIASDGEGHQGWGVAAAVTADELDRTIERARALLAAAAAGPEGDRGGEVGGGRSSGGRPSVGSSAVEGLLAVEGLEAAGATVPEDRWSKWAACALATAGWDLAARRAGVSCADLWRSTSSREADADRDLGGDRGPSAAPASLDCYASGLFLGTTDDALAAEAQGYRDAGYTKVKMRTGGPVERDLERLAVVRRSFPEPGAIAVDAVNGWDPAGATRFLHGAGALLWVEDPVPLDVIGELAGVEGPIAAGESLTTLPELDALHTEGGVEAMLLDVQQLGGPERFLAAARHLQAAGARVGAHIFTHVSAHLLAALDDPLPVEVFDWSDALCSTVLRPASSGRLPVAGPGLGVALDRDGLAVHGTRIAVTPPI